MPGAGRRSCRGGASAASASASPCRACCCSCMPAIGMAWRMVVVGGARRRGAARSHGTCGARGDAHVAHDDRTGGPAALVPGSAGLLLPRRRRIHHRGHVPRCGHRPDVTGLARQRSVVVGRSGRGTVGRAVGDGRARGGHAPTLLVVALLVQAVGIALPRAHRRRRTRGDRRGARSAARSSG